MDTELARIDETRALFDPYHDHPPATWDDYEYGMIGVPMSARNVRRLVREKTGVWRDAQIRAATAHAKKLESDFDSHSTDGRHIGWLAGGGPQRMADEIGLKLTTCQASWASAMAYGVADLMAFCAGCIADYQWRIEALEELYGVTHGT